MNQLDISQENKHSNTLTYLLGCLGLEMLIEQTNNALSSLVHNPELFNTLPLFTVVQNTRYIFKHYHQQEAHTRIGMQHLITTEGNADPFSVKYLLSLPRHRLWVHIVVSKTSPHIHGIYILKGHLYQDIHSLSGMPHST